MTDGAPDQHPGPPAAPADRTGPFGGTLGFGRSPVLMLVDVCRAYVDPESPFYAAVEDSVDSMRRIVTAAREHDVPIVWTRVEYEPGGADGGYFYKKVPALKAFDAGSPLLAWVPGLEPADGETVYTKQFPSAFVGTAVADDLHARGIDTVVICGWSTSGCVRATGVDAISHGFIPIIAREGVGDRDPGPHEANLFDLHAKYADVVSEADVIDHFTTRSA